VSANGGSLQGTYPLVASRKPKPIPRRRSKKVGHWEQACEPPDSKVVDNELHAALLGYMSPVAPTPLLAPDSNRRRSMRKTSGLLESELPTRWARLPGALHTEIHHCQAVATKSLQQPTRESSVAARPRRKQMRRTRWKAVPIFFGSFPEPVYCRYPVPRTKPLQCAYGNALPVRTAPLYDRVAATGGNLP